MKSLPKLKILLDSAYLLPIVGIEVEGVNEILSVLAKIWNEGRAEFYYTPFNLIEVISKVAKTKYNREVVYLGFGLHYYF